MSCISDGCKGRQPTQGEAEPNKGLVEARRFGNVLEHRDREPGILVRRIQVLTGPLSLKMYNVIQVLVVILVTQTVARLLGGLGRRDDARDRFHHCEGVQESQID